MNIFPFPLQIFTFINLLTSPTTPLNFPQIIDHFRFGPAALQTFNQIYYQNSIFIVDNTSINSAVLYIGGESSISNAAGGNLTNPDIFGRVAQQFNAPIFSLEHRFYGASQPFANDSQPLAQPHLAYLSSRFAIADLVYFVMMKDKEYCALLNKTYVPGKTCLAWMVGGGSYAGALAAWLAQQHPNLFAATISSSGVVDCEYNDVVFDSHTLAAGGTPCSNAYIVANRQIEQVTQSGNSTYLDMFNATNTYINDFYFFIADSGLQVFQYGNWTRMCPKLLINIYQQSGDVTDAFANYILDNGYNYQNYNRINLANASDTISDYPSRQWWWQKCTEVAYYQPAPSINNIRNQNLTLDYFNGMCQFLYNFSFDPTPRTNTFYGSTKVYGPDTFFYNAWQDIWHLNGINGETNGVPSENIGYIIYRDVGHCRDLHVWNASDPQVLQQVKNDEVNFVADRFKAWLARE